MAEFPSRRSFHQDSGVGTPVMRSCLLIVSAFFWSPISPPSDLASQEVGISFTAAESNLLELPAPLGIEAYAMMEFNPAWNVRVSFRRIADETGKAAQVCRVYAPHIGCRLEDTHTSLSLSGLRVGVMRVFSLGELFRVGAGVGLSFNHLDGEAKGVSGLKADLLLPNGGQLGALGLFSLAFSPYRPIPIRVVGDFDVHWVKFNTCSGASPPQYDPFCTPSSFLELGLGVSYTF